MSGRIAAGLGSSGRGYFVFLSSILSMQGFRSQHAAVVDHQSRASLVQKQAIDVDIIV